MNWIAIWGVAEGARFIFAPILEDLARDTTKDWAKDFCKDAFNHVFQRDEWTKATGKALKEFLEEFNVELVRMWKLSPGSYTNALKAFTGDKEVRLALGSAITEPLKQLDSAGLSRRWKELELLSLPESFNWGKLCARYQHEVSHILKQSKELREMLGLDASIAAARAIQRAGVISPGFDLGQYAGSIKKRFEYLLLERLDPTANIPIHLVKIFTEQNVRDCQRFIPQIYEIPIEYRNRLHPQRPFLAETKGLLLERLRQDYLAQPPAPILEEFRTWSNRLVVILGDPGSGKSILLQYLAMKWANQPVPDSGDRPVITFASPEVFFAMEDLS